MAQTIKQGELILPESRSPSAIALFEADKAAEFVGHISKSLFQGVDQDRFFLNTVVALNKVNENCTLESVVMTVMNAGNLGLQFSDKLGHCYPIAYWNSDSDSYRLQLVVGYKGYLHLAFDMGFLARVSSEVVCNDEEFEMTGTEEGLKMVHKIRPDRSPTRKNITGAYCSYTTKFGNHGVAYVPRSALDKVDTHKFVWNADYPAMCKKTAMIRASNEWQLTSRMAGAVMLDQQAARGEAQGFIGNEEDAPFGDGPAKPDEDTNAQKVLDAKLLSIGCKSARAMDQVVQYVTEQKYDTIAEAWGTEGGSSEVLKAIRDCEQAGTALKDLLKTARAWLKS